MLNVARGTKNLVTAFLNRFIPWAGSAESPDELFKAQLVCGISLAFATSSIFYMVLTFSRGFGPALTAICAIATVAHSGTVVLLRKRERLQLASQLLLVDLFVLLGASAAFSTGAQFYNSVWQLCIPLLAVFLTGPRKALLIAAAMALAAVCFYELEVTGVWIAPYALVPTDRTMNLMTTITGLLMVVGIGAVGS